MGAHRPIPTAGDADARSRGSAPGVALAPDMRGHFSTAVFAEAAERIQRSMRQNASEAPIAVAALVADALERTSGQRIRDQARLARQMLLWHESCAPDRAHRLTIAALADRAGALRRSVSRRRLECGPGE